MQRPLTGARKTMSVKLLVTQVTFSHAPTPRILFLPLIQYTKETLIKTSTPKIHVKYTANRHNVKMMIASDRHIGNRAFSILFDLAEHSSLRCSEMQDLSFKTIELFLDRDTT